MLPIPSVFQLHMALLICAMLAGLLAWKRPAYRCAAVALGGLAIVDTAGGLLRVAPGIPRGVLAALFIGWYGVEAAAAGHVLARDKSPWLALGWAAVALAVGFTWAKLAPYGEAIYAGAFATSLVIQVGSLGMFTLRRPREVPRAHELAVAILVVSSIFDALGPWITGHPRRDWPYGAWISLLTWAMLAGLEIVWISTRERCSPPLDS